FFFNVKFSSFLVIKSIFIRDFVQFGQGIGAARSAFLGLVSVVEPRRTNQKMTPKKIKKNPSFTDIYGILMLTVKYCFFILID
ncbi:MAG: hypothetical protein IKI98_01895, partial [Spirochaetaceae bacterium]|nr:hypothetical protein [Spirochaetaceae bacterium]